jgi:hypothetical protein
MGLTATAKVITRAEYYSRRSSLQPGNREWVTVIEAINATGWALPPYIIFKGKVFIESWFDELPDQWRLMISPNGWTTDEIGLEWLQKSFIPAIQGRLTGKYCLLVLDGHGSHLTPQFDQICDQNNIIPICMPAHSSHLLQPLDVACFATLKRGYGDLVRRQIHNGINHIDKLDFLSTYPIAQQKALITASIQSGFNATGLVPYNPDRVLSKLTIRLKTPTPPPSERSTSSTANTPQNTRQLQRRVSSIKNHLKVGSQSPPIGVQTALNQLVKCTEFNIHSTALLTEEVRGLRATIANLTRKRTLSKRRISHNSSLAAHETSTLIESPQSAVQTDAVATAQVSNQAVKPPKRAQARCSGCGETGHNIRNCTKQ